MGRRVRDLKRKRGRNLKISEERENLNL